MVDVLLDTLLDTFKLFIIILIFHIIISFIEKKLIQFLNKSRISPVLGAFVGLIPQCGISILSSEFFVENRITLGTIIAVFIACSDESLPILLSNLNTSKYAFLLIIIKFLLACIIGIIVDLIYKYRKEKETSKIDNNNEHVINDIHGCCNHELDCNESQLKTHFIHPLLHALKISLYLFIISFIYGTLFYFIGEEKVALFFDRAKYFGPVIATLIGFIPNCASSVILSNLFIKGSISFGSLMSGLIANAGLGLFYLLKHKEKRKEIFLIFVILFSISILMGYIINIIMVF
ncbi:MAG: putative manganese transporter [Bacilli bacterium]